MKLPSQVIIDKEHCTDALSLIIPVLVANSIDLFTAYMHVMIKTLQYIPIYTAVNEKTIVRQLVVAVHMPTEIWTLHLNSTHQCID